MESIDDLKAMDNWDPLKEDYYNPSLSIIKNEGPLKNYSRKIWNNLSSKEPVGLYIRNIPPSMSINALRALISIHAPTLSVKIFKPNHYVKNRKLAGIIKVESTKMALTVIEAIGGKPPLKLQIELSLSIEERDNRRKISEVLNEVNPQPFEDEKKSTNGPIKPSLLKNVFNIAKSQIDTSNTCSLQEKEVSKTDPKKAPQNNSGGQELPRKEVKESEIHLNVGKNGKKFINPMGCSNCGFLSRMQCASCKDFYCSKKCQLKDWNKHQSLCQQKH